MPVDYRSLSEERRRVLLDQVELQHFQNEKYPEYKKIVRIRKSIYNNQVRLENNRRVRTRIKKRLAKLQILKKKAATAWKQKRLELGRTR